jgi:hypothetical protein
MQFVEFIKNNKKSVAILFIVFIVVSVIFNATKSGFYDTLTKPVDSIVNNEQPLSFPPLTSTPQGTIPIVKPDVPEEIGFAMVYPQGSGVGMEKVDSNSFEPGNPGPLLTDYVNPESYGESSLADPTGKLGSDQGCRVIRFSGTGNQSEFKPIDSTDNTQFASAYGTGEVQKGNYFINGNMPINYNSSFVPEQNLVLQTSPGQSSTLANCEKTYPNVVKYDGLCITEGDIPYGKVVDGKVNPRLVSRWQSYTGDYSPEEALKPIDGVLYPNLSVLTSM